MNSNCCRHDQHALAELHRLEEGRLLRVIRDCRVEVMLVVRVPALRGEKAGEGDNTLQTSDFDLPCATLSLGQLAFTFVQTPIQLHMQLHCSQLQRSCGWLCVWLRRADLGRTRRPSRSSWHTSFCPAWSPHSLCTATPREPSGPSRSPAPARPTCCCNSGARLD